MLATCDGFAPFVELQLNQVRLRFRNGLGLGSAIGLVLGIGFRLWLEFSIRISVRPTVIGRLADT